MVLTELEEAYAIAQHPSVVEQLKEYRENPTDRKAAELVREIRHLIAPQEHGF